MQEKEFVVATPNEFLAVIEYVLSLTPRINQRLCIALSGDLGAGKTTFTQQLAKYLGVTAPVVSPTFGIMKLYEVTDYADFDQLVHIDAYRIEDISEAGPLHLDELFLQPRTLICLEWPEQISEILPTDQVLVTITNQTDAVRTVTVRNVSA